MDYKALQGKYLDAETQEKHTAILLNDIGEDLEPTVEVVGGDRLSLGGDVSITVVETPGHSIGSVTFVLEGENWAFAADAVQMYGGALSGIPTIEYPALYRKSLLHLLEEVRPERLYLGHHFRDANGTIISPEVEGEAVTNALQASLEMDAKLADIVERHLANDTQSNESDGLYGPFGSIADDDWLYRGSTELTLRILCNDECLSRRTYWCKALNERRTINMIQKKFENTAQAVADMQDGATLLVGGFGGSGLPSQLVAALVEQGAKNLTVVSNNIGAVSDGVAALISNNQVSKIICSFPVGPHAEDLIERLQKGTIELEIVPQGTLAERIRAGGAGIPAFYTPTAAHTELGEGKETREYQRSFACLRKCNHRRLCFYQGTSGRPLGEPRLPKNTA